MESTDTTAVIYDLFLGEGEASKVHSLRDEYGADLVQLIGIYTDTCGIG